MPSETDIPTLQISEMPSEADWRFRRHCAAKAVYAARSNSMEAARSDRRAITP
ncbi:TPA: hypothetical protein ACFRG8_000012 [Neisseria lactamica]